MSRPTKKRANTGRTPYLEVDAADVADAPPCPTCRRVGLGGPLMLTALLVLGGGEVIDRSMLDAEWTGWAGLRLHFRSELGLGFRV